MTISLNDPKVIAAIISASVSIITVILSFMFKSFFERHFYVFKLESEHQYEQRKKIKEILSRNKIHLLSASDSLRHRLWNLLENYPKNWHVVRNEMDFVDSYYLRSFVYRILCFFAWIRKLEREIVYLDTTVASKQDLELIKFLRLFPAILCDVQLFSGFN